jgi:hypothetical protein
MFLEYCIASVFDWYPTFWGQYSGPETSDTNHPVTECHILEEQITQSYTEVCRIEMNNMSTKEGTL